MEFLILCSVDLVVKRSQELFTIWPRLGWWLSVSVSYVDMGSSSAISLLKIVKQYLVPFRALTSVTPFAAL